ncbi:MAG TPA: dihydropteroate synthase, partial [Candidatus Ozemobacteraceae bacterium]|nr:dihydropteroate synthase [Candidatus Ozemobacteraceae bacterium]
MNGRILAVDSEELLIHEMKSIGPEAAGLEIMKPKGQFLVIRLEGITCAAANILKQEMLSRGGEAVISNMIYRLQDRTPTKALVMGTRAQFEALIGKLRVQPLKTLQAVADELIRLLACGQTPELPSMNVGNHVFDWAARTYVMGIINVTPDSFSGDGLSNDLEKIAAQGRRFAETGADLLDIGGESTRPGSAPVSIAEELKRVIPAIRQLRQETPLPVSVDTSRAEVAEAALSEGAVMINDVWGLKKDPGLGAVIARADAAVVLMHNRESSGTVASDR